MFVLIICVPVLFSAYVLSENSEYRLVYVLLFALLVAALALGAGMITSRASLLAFHGLFAALFAGSIPTGLRAGGYAMYTQIQTLSMCYIWSSGFFVAFVFLRTRADVDRALVWLRWIGLAVTASVCAGAMLWLAAGIQFGEIVDAYGQFRSFGPLGDQVGFVIVLFALSSMVRRAWLQFGFHAAALILTGTRGAMLCLAVGALWLAVAGIAKRRGPSRAGMLLRLLFAGAVIAGLVRLPFASTFADRLVSDQRDATFSDRLSGAKLGLMVFEQSPMFGVGYGGFRDYVGNFAVGEYFAEGVDVDRDLFTTANQYIQTATDGGVPALCCLLWFAWLVIRNTGRAAAGERGQTRDELLAIQAYAIAIFVGDQSAVWLLPHASAGYFLLLSAGIAERALAIREGVGPAAAGAPHAVSLRPTWGRRSTRVFAN
jgi:O-antigen ligase